MAGLPLGVKCSACFCMSGRRGGSEGGREVALLTSSVGSLSLDKLISNHVVTGDKLANKGGKSNKMKWVGKAWQVWTHQLEIVARLLCFREISR